MLIGEREIEESLCKSGWSSGIELMSEQVERLFFCCLLKHEEGGKDLIGELEIKLLDDVGETLKEGFVKDFVLSKLP